MAHRFVIDFGPESPTLMSRVRNCGEDLYRGFLRTGEAEMSIDEVDSATNQLHVTVRATRHLGTATAFIEKTLKQHGFEDVARVTRQK